MQLPTKIYSVIGYWPKKLDHIYFYTALFNLETQVLEHGLLEDENALGQGLTDPCRCICLLITSSQMTLLIGYNLSMMLYLHLS